MKNKILCMALLACLVAAFPAAAKEKGKGTAKKSSELYKGLDLFSKVINLVREDYVEEVKEKEMIYGAIKGMLATLDPHSIFMPPDVYKELKVDTEGRFGGVGLEVTVKDNFLVVVTPIEGSPASRSGLREGDRILRIDGISAKDLGLSEAVRKMRGARGTRVVLTVYRNGMKEPFDVVLIRDIIRIKSVRTEMPEEGIGYVRITSFQEDTAEELQRGLDSFEKKARSGLRGLVIDLRNNPGGLLDEAVDVSDIFLESGTIVSTKSRAQELDKRLASKSGHEPSYPMVVIVNGGSASAAEIVAGALQDHDRAVILGTQSFGKGSVQTIFEIGEGAALKLTVAKYYTPKGRSIQVAGIKPDVVVEARRPSAPVAPKEGKVVELPTPGDEDSQKKAALDYLRNPEVFKRRPQSLGLQ